MAQTLNLRAKGLQTAPNDLSTNPEVSLSRADDMAIDDTDAIDPRRGYGKLTYDFLISSERADRLHVYGSTLIAHHGSTKLSWYNSGSGWTSLSTAISPPDATLARVRFAEAVGNLYFTTSKGIYKMDAGTVTPFAAGIPTALDGSGATTGVAGFLANAFSTAYRVVFGLKDLNNNLILGGPSQRIVVTNTSGGTRDVALSFTIPAGITVNHLYQVYRAPQVTSAAEPSDEMNLVFEGNPTGGQIAALVVTLTDSTPEALRNGPALYTNPSQEGILQSNDQPPFCWDFCFFRGCGIYANVIGKQRRTITLVGVGGAGLALNDTIIISGITYTAKNAENIAANEFARVTGGSPSQNISDTAQSLVKVINRSASSIVYARYVSGYQELPGKFVLEERLYGGSPFAITSTAAAATWSPPVPSSGITYVSAADTNANGVYISKQNLPEAVPLLNLKFAGSRAKKILRVVPLTESVIIYKEDGIFRLTGLTPNDFDITEVDSTILLSPDSAVVMGEVSYAFTDQGITATGTSVEVKSRAIEDQLRVLIGTALSTLKAVSFGIAYTVNRTYEFYTVSDSEDTAPQIAFVYNAFTNTWVKKRRPQTAGIVHPTEERLYLANADSASVSVERKSFTADDFYDEALPTAFSIVSFSGKLVELNSVADVEVGDLLYQSVTKQSVITEISGNIVTVEGTLSWAIAAATVFPAIESVIEWQPQTAGNPGIAKQFSEALVLFKRFRSISGKLDFKTDYSPSFEAVTFAGAAPGGWGQFPWGTVPWGGQVVIRPVRVTLPAEKQTASQLTVRLTVRGARSDWRLQGISQFYDNISTEVRR